MYYVEKRLEISAAHRLELDYESKCTNIHGHNWIVTIYCKARELNDAGMVSHKQPFGDGRPLKGLSLAAVDAGDVQMQHLKGLPGPELLDGKPTEHLRAF